MSENARRTAQDIDPAQPACPEWCNVDHGQDKPFDAAYHSSGTTATFPASAVRDNETLGLYLCRLDTDDDQPGEVTVGVTVGMHGVDLPLGEAVELLTELGSLIAEAREAVPQDPELVPRAEQTAEQGQPAETLHRSAFRRIGGPRRMEAQDVRVGDLLRNGTRWERVTVLLADVWRHEVTIYTTDDEAAAMRVGLHHPVTVVRQRTSRTRRLIRAHRPGRAS